MIDLSQVSLALRGATPRSLLILDEFGKGLTRWTEETVLTLGTAPADGAGLLAGTIKYISKETKARTIVLTHFQ